MTTNPPSRQRSNSRYLALAWFGLVGLAVVVGVMFVLVPNEGLFVFGRESCVAYALAFILSVAILGLPLLVLAAVLDRKARNLS